MIDKIYCLLLSINPEVDMLQISHCSLTKKAFTVLKVTPLIKAQMSMWQEVSCDAVTSQ